MNSDSACGTDIAVVGATGKTGKAVVAALEGRATVRPLSRTAPEHPIDLDTGEGLEAAFAGCTGMYFIAPNLHPDEPAALRRALEAASDAGVQHLLYHSVAWPYSPRMPHHMDKARCEDDLRAFASRHGMRWTILQPCAYAQNFDSILTGESTDLVVPYSTESKFSFVSLGDVAEVAARILLAAEEHHGATYELGGPEAMSVGDVVRLVGRMTSRSVTVERLTVDEWMRTYGQGLGVEGRTRLGAMFEFYDDRDFLAGATVTKALLGRGPTPVRALVR